MIIYVFVSRLSVSLILFASLFNGRRTIWAFSFSSVRHDTDVTKDIKTVFQTAEDFL